MDILSSLQNVRSRPRVGYAAALAGPPLAAAITIAINDRLTGYPFITFIVVVGLVALIGTYRAAIVATLFCAALAYRSTVYIGDIAQGNSDWIGLVIFFTVSGILIMLVHGLALYAVTTTTCTSVLAYAHR